MAFYGECTIIIHSRLVMDMRLFPVSTWLQGTSFCMGLGPHLGVFPKEQWLGFLGHTHPLKKPLPDSTDHSWKTEGRRPKDDLKQDHESMVSHLTLWHIWSMMESGVFGSHSTSNMVTLGRHPKCHCLDPPWKEGRLRFSDGAVHRPSQVNKGMWHPGLRENEGIDSRRESGKI